MDCAEMDSNIHLPHYSNGIRVLLVEYDQISLSQSILFLRKASFKVSPTKIQQVALTLLRELKGQYNLLITSDQKQEMDCHSFIQRIRFIDDEIPIIVVSSLESNADQGLRTLFDSGCYMVNKPVTENALWCVLQRHLLRRTSGNGSSLVPKGREEELAGNQTTAKGDHREEEHGLQVEKNRNLKRSKPCENEDEEEAAKENGKCVVEPSKTNGSKAMKVSASARPTFDPEQHKKLMEAVAYGGPTKPIGMTNYLSSTRQDKEKKIKGAFSTTPRAPWTQHLYQRFVQAMSYSDVPGMGGYGYGVQQPHPFQMTGLRPRPSWVSPQDWRTQLHSEFLNSTSDVAWGAGGYPMFGLSSHCKAPTAINGGLNITEGYMPMDTNMETFYRLNGSVLGMKGARVNGMGQNLNLGTQFSPILLDEGNTSNALVLNQGNGALNGFFHEAQDEMRFSSFARDNSHSRHPHTAVYNGNSEVPSSYRLQTELGHLNYYDLLEAEKGNSMTSAPINGFNESVGYGQNMASNELVHTEIASPYGPVSINEPGLHAANPPDFTPIVTGTFCVLPNAYDLSTSNAALQMTELKSSIGESDGQEVPGTGLLSSGYAPPYSSVNEDGPDVHVMNQQQLSASGANAPFGLQNASNFPIKTSGFLAAVDDSSLQAVVRSCFQNSNGALPTGSQVNLRPNLMPGWSDTFPQTNQIREYNAIEREVEEYVNHEPVKEQNAVPGQAFVTPLRNEVDIANGSSKQASEEKENTKNLNSQGHVDEFAELFTFLDAYQGGTNPVSEEEEEVNSDKGTAEVDHSYFDIGSFDFS